MADTYWREAKVGEASTLHICCDACCSVVDGYSGPSLVPVVGALFIEDREAAVERMVALEWGSVRCRNPEWMRRLLAAAAAGEGER